MILRRYWPAALVFIGLLAVLAGILLLVRRPAPAPRAALPAPIIQGGGFTSPSPVPGFPDGLRVRVPELGIDLPVVPGDGVNAPLYKAATDPRLKLPGENHRSMIYAHARDGMFGPLFHAATGQHVEVAEPNGRVLRYTIREYYPRWPSTDLKWLQPADHEELILLTCTTYNVNDPRIVAVAEPG